MADEIVELVDAVGCVCTCTEAVANQASGLKCCIDNDKCTVMTNIIGLLSNMAIAGWNIFVIHQLVILHGERSELFKWNLEGYHVYLVAGVLMTVTILCMIIFLGILLYKALRNSTSQRSTRLIVFGLVIQLCDAITSLLLSLGLFLMQFETCKTLYDELVAEVIQLLGGISSGTQVAWGLVSLVLSCKMLSQMVVLHKQQKNVKFHKLLLSFKIPILILGSLAVGMALCSFCSYLRKAPVCEMNIRTISTDECETRCYSCWSSNETKMKTFDDAGDLCWPFKQWHLMQWPSVPGSADPWVSDIQDSLNYSTASSNEVWRGFGWKFERKASIISGVNSGDSFRLIQEAETSFLSSAMNYLPIIFLPFAISCLALLLFACCKCK